jgi:hypothetical protein
VFIVCECKFVLSTGKPNIAKGPRVISLISNCLLLTETSCSKLNGHYLRVHPVIINGYFLLRNLDQDQRELKVILIELELRTPSVLFGHAPLKIMLQVKQDLIEYKPV